MLIQNVQNGNGFVRPPGGVEADGEHLVVPLHAVDGQLALPCHHGGGVVAQAQGVGGAQAQQTQAQANLRSGPAQAGTAHGFFQTREGTGARRFGGGRRPEQRALFPDP